MNIKNHPYFILITAVFILFSFQIYNFVEKSFIPPSLQRAGDATKGYDYLVSGDYVSSGIPYAFFKDFGLLDSSNVLKRNGEASLIPPQFNLIENTEGIKILTPNCLSCHADSINGEFIVGLGNNSFDYRIDVQATNKFIGVLVGNKFGFESKEYKAFEPLKKASDALSGQLITKIRGLNPADKLTAVLIAHRNSNTLEWSDSLLLDIPEQTIPTDVPPWWLLKKKNAMFYTAIGRGDFSKFLMASSILTLKDTTEAKVIDERFPDILAWINTLEAPEYPAYINKEKSKLGRKLFELNCSSCHGTYEEQESYPNFLVSLDLIKTDPELSLAYTDSLYSGFIDWYNESWFVQGSHPGRLVIEPGYIAPPLDGIWATAPYLHNGSVPTVEGLLNSAIRPKYWKRSYNSKDYDFDALGWKFNEYQNDDNCNCYDTTVKAYGNQGHDFGDDLSQKERMAIIEYLKTL